MQEQLRVLINTLQGAWLNRKYILISAWILCPLGWLWVTLLPNQYTSEAKVYADTQSILQPLLRGIAIQTDPSQKLNLMAKTLLNTRNLETIGQEIDANIIATTAEEYEELLEELKENIKIQSTARNNLYTISYTGNDPVYAKNVVQAALDVFIESTLGDKRLDQEQASEVISDQISYYENRLINAEKDLAQFKREYIGFLPGSDKSYYANLEQQQFALEQAELELKEAISRLNEANSQLEQEKTNALNGSYSIETEFDTRISAVEIRLDELLFRYTEKHPDVIETKRQIEELKELRTKTMTKQLSGDGLKDNLVFQDLKITINQLGNEIASLEVRVDKHRNKIDALKSKLERIPDVEAMLTSLTRNYDITKNKYEELLSRGERASISHSIGSSSSDIKFKIIEPPKIPTSASGPNRVLLLSAVLVVGLGIGGGVSFTVSQINPVIFSTDQLYRVTGVPVFGVVSATDSSGILMRTNRSKRLFLFVSSLLVLAYAMAIVITLNPESYQSIYSNVYKILNL
ncbi:XrtA system polysaccharide chain length determinant [Vibrio alfacsensis]|uniref:XrtA system polysaccharide chain length determinant n=1 Tax=Vibrio alfacsensis TaxID=1074311 RepID=UPI0040687AD4